MQIVIPDTTWQRMCRDSQRYTAFADFQSAWADEMAEPGRLGDLFYLCCKADTTPPEGVPTRLQNLYVIRRLIANYQLQSAVNLRDGYMSSVGDWVKQRQSNTNERAYAIGTPLKYIYHYVKQHVNNNDAIIAEDVCCLTRQFYDELT